MKTQTSLTDKKYKTEPNTSKEANTDNSSGYNLRKRRRSYENRVQNNQATLKKESSSPGLTSRKEIKEEYKREYDRQMSSLDKVSQFNPHKRIKRDHDEDYRSDKRLEYSHSTSKRQGNYSHHYTPSFLVPCLKSCPPRKKGGEEETRILEGGKIRKKIYLPRKNGVNYIGLLIGPRGMYQKKLEEDSNCKILIRGNLPLLRRGNREGPYKAEDNDHEHVLIITDNKENLKSAEDHIKKIINATEEERDQIRKDQLKAALKISQSVYQELDESLLTPYGPPSPFAHIIPVPNECVGLIIGRGGETIRHLQVESGAKIQVAKKEVENTSMRNVFIEGPPEKYEKARKLIEDVVEEHKKLHEKNGMKDRSALQGDPIKFEVPQHLIGLIIGFRGDTIHSIQSRTRTTIIVPKDSKYSKNSVAKSEHASQKNAIVEIYGSTSNCCKAQREIKKIISSIESSRRSHRNPYPNSRRYHSTSARVPLKSESRIELNSEDKSTGLHEK
ncbi:unnamed protein product [Moneuplotes crassus]|uniref:K Homology domain-containing protein n=1 Tax=Euplotes crassus TaxID=5936 RepID=A0AAD1UHF1_EUPCR|nr:unnamed protein product [Moneuplotes crassus]